jgi:hypothetical protein
MVSVVPAGGANSPPPRIMPKVFADVPSQRELEKAQKSSKTMGGFVAVLLLLLIGAGGYVAYEILINRKAMADSLSTEAGKQLNDVKAQLKTAQDNLKKEADNNKKLSGVYEPFKAIATAEAEVTDYRKQIDERLTQYPAARDRTRIEYKDHWKAYDTALVWKGVNKAEVGQDLQNKSKLLVALLKKIDEIRPPTTTPGAPACTDPARCAPTGARPN